MSDSTDEHWPASRLTHLDEAGAARMVDVSDKAVTSRTATASGRVRVSREVVRLLRGSPAADGTTGGLPKGDALAVARIAGIMGAKRTADLIPLCHPLGLSRVEVALGVGEDAVDITATVGTADRTGVEMEALTAVSVAALTVIDMVKAVDRGAVIEHVQVESKDGGRRGRWRRGDGEQP
jgi:cyclic pyranopterin monophosphate synthase